MKADTLVSVNLARRARPHPRCLLGAFNQRKPVSRAEQRRGSLASSGKTMGLILIGIGVVIGLAVGAWLLAGLAEDSMRLTGALLGLVLLLLFIVAPLVGGGVFILNKGRSEERELAHVRDQRALLDIVKTRGQVQISDLVIELKSTRDKVQQTLHDLVGRGLFSGYVDWDKGVLYSVEASQLNGRTSCPNCGGQLELAGKGLIKCPY